MSHRATEPRDGTSTHRPRKSGFLGSAPVDVNGAAVAPVDFTAALLSSQPQFQYGEDDEDLTWIRVRNETRGMPSRASPILPAVRPLPDH
jgi:hypothetical protein